MLPVDGPFPAQMLASASPSLALLRCDSSPPPWSFPQEARVTYAEEDGLESSKGTPRIQGLFHPVALVGVSIGHAAFVLQHLFPRRPEFALWVASMQRGPRRTRFRLVIDYSDISERVD
jgi:hypothetical protein